MKISCSLGTVYVLHKMHKAQAPNSLIPSTHIPSLINNQISQAIINILLRILQQHLPLVSTKLFCGFYKTHLLNIFTASLFHALSRIYNIIRLRCWDIISPPHRCVGAWNINIFEHKKRFTFYVLYIYYASTYHKMEKITYNFFFLRCRYMKLQFQFQFLFKCRAIFNERIFFIF